MLVLPSPKSHAHEVAFVERSEKVTMSSLSDETKDATGVEQAVTVILVQILSVLHGLVTTKHTVYVPGAE